MIKYLTGAVVLILILALGMVGSLKVGAQELEISAESAILMDRESGRVLWEKDAHRALPMASVTKIMTALLALELGERRESVVISREAAHTGGSSIWLEAGEIKTLEELLYGLMLCSGNDAAVAIAEQLAGTVENFALLMNWRARQLGAVNSSFINPHGLPDERHYSTAYDLALISCQALKNPLFRDIISTDCWVITCPHNDEGRFLNNQNRLLKLYPGGDGIKTGWTKKAGSCFAGSATKSNWQLVTVVLDAPRMWEDTISLLDYGYRTYTREKIISAGQVLAYVPTDYKSGYIQAVAEKDFYLPLRPGEGEGLQYKWRLIDLHRPSSGGRLGKVEIYLDGLLLGSVQLKAGLNIKTQSFWSQFVRLSLRLLGG
ncbi:MAG: D-alanyl-D-alanine carboxypeptidase [Firmicutes bacterium]|nr:D-alanyl-D-alanine carboxypeptidase [Bacillota bacterium]